MPRGVYRFAPVSLERGSWVVFCLVGEVAQVARERAYVRPGECQESGLMPAMKQVGAVPGDQVKLSPKGFRVNGEPLGGPLKEFDRSGRVLSLTQFGEFEVGPETYWVWSVNHEVGWDSRYFGPIRRDQIIGGAEPVWLWDAWPAPESAQGRAGGGGE